MKTNIMKSTTQIIHNHFKQRINNITDEFNMLMLQMQIYENEFNSDHLIKKNIKLFQDIDGTLDSFNVEILELRYLLLNQNQNQNQNNTTFKSSINPLTKKEKQILQDERVRLKVLKDITPLMILSYMKNIDK